MRRSLPWSRGNRPPPWLSRSLPARPRTEPVRGTLLPWVRAGAAVLFVLAVANGVFLYVLSDRARTDYAWPIKPSASAAFMGAGYLAGAVATGLVVFAARRWRSVQPLALGLVVLSVLLLIATVVHRDKFRWEYAPTWIWTGVYALAPPTILVAMHQQRANTDVPTPDSSLDVLRGISLVGGLVLLAVAVPLYVAPVRFGAHWPWPLTPLLARVVASWLALIATAQLWCAVGLRRRHEAFIPYSALATWCLLLLAIPALHHSQMRPLGSALIAYLAGLGALLALAIYGIARADSHAI